MFGAFVGGFMAFIGAYSAYRFVRSGFAQALAEAAKQGWKEGEAREGDDDEGEEVSGGKRNEV